MIPKTMWQYEIFRMREISFMEMYIVLAVILYAFITCFLFAIVKKQNKWMLLGFMIFPAILIVLAGISGWYGFWKDAMKLLKLALDASVKGCIFTWIYTKLHKIADKFFECEE